MWWADKYQDGVVGICVSQNGGTKHFDVGNKVLLSGDRSVDGLTDDPIAVIVNPLPFQQCIVFDELIKAFLRVEVMLSTFHLVVTAGAGGCGWKLAQIADLIQRTAHDCVFPYAGWPNKNKDETTLWSLGHGCCTFSHSPNAIRLSDSLAGS